MTDVNGNLLRVGDRVAVAFKYGSSGKLRLGKIHRLNENHNMLEVQWDANDKISPPLAHYPHRVIIL